MRHLMERSDLGVELGETLVGEGMAMPEGWTTPGTILIFWGQRQLGDVGIVRDGAREGQIRITSLQTRTMHEYRVEDVARIRPIAVIPPPPEGEGLVDVVDGQWYGLLDGRTAVARNRRWHLVGIYGEEPGTIELPFFPMVVPFVDVPAWAEQVGEGTR